jgi:Na+-driven multidrug efflux pump
MSAVTTAAFRSMSDSRAPMVLARMPRWLSAHCRALFQITYPIALSELLWGTSTFVYIIVFTRIGTDALAASQIVTMIENIFIVGRPDWRRRQWRQLGRL